MEQKILEILSELEKKPNRHLSFFEGIIPSLETFSDDKILQFQSRVIEVMMDIKQQRQAGPTMSRTLHNQCQVSLPQNQLRMRKKKKKIASINKHSTIGAHICFRNAHTGINNGRKCTRIKKTFIFHFYLFIFFEI